MTGGGGGIGRAICESLAAADRRVAVADLALDHAQSVAEKIGGLAIELDVTDSKSVELAVARTVEELGPVDILVNCAGWDEFKPFIETDDAFLQKVLAINLAGPMCVTRVVGGRLARHIPG